MEYEFILTETRQRVGLVRINRPKQLNALNPRTMIEMADACAAGHALSAKRKCSALAPTGGA